jgi:DNA ligase-1
MASIEWKLDGARLQIHRRAGDVRLFTRTPRRGHRRLPEIVDDVLAVPAESMVADGEAIALKPDGGRSRSRSRRRGSARVRRSTSCARDCR